MTTGFQDWVVERKIVRKEKPGGRGTQIHT